MEALAPAIREHEVNTEAVCPWLANPYALVSWWDVEKFSAAGFYRLALSLANMIASAEVDIKHGATAENLDPESKKYLKDLCDGAARDCDLLGLKTSNKAAIYASVLAEHKDAELAEIHAAMDHLSQNIGIRLSNAPCCAADFHGRTLFKGG